MEEHWELKNAHSSISLDHVSQRDMFYIKWCGHINSEDVIQTALKYIELQKGRNCPKILNDKSEVTGDWEEANDWLEFEWLPRAVASGLKCFAMVLTRDLHDLGAALDLERRFTPECRVKLFKEPDAAQEWLDTCH
ncbi:MULTISPECIES: hypothetical protein [Rufibacter]|uniref:STAS/SEC14 domain-containing protein n=1 Tax=Rufibacter quisquiliarum TaxID=1549639 RepID=A0A839GDX5_9BACT|nr:MULTISPECIES: hypothetical protein [Rufibacter]MBA9075733.1 hypothetical protein [Rufibacter quisquiliarum]